MINTLGEYVQWKQPRDISLDSELDSDAAETKKQFKSIMNV